jgi:hypothetical protein
MGKRGSFLIMLIRTLSFRNDRFQDVKPEMKSKISWPLGRKSVVFRITRAGIFPRSS